MGTPPSHTEIPLSRLAPTMGVANLPYAVQLQDSHNVLEGRRRGLAWTLFLVTLLIILGIFLTLFFVMPETVNVAVTTEIPDHDNGFECACLGYSFGGLFTKAKLMEYMAEGLYALYIFDFVPDLHRRPENVQLAIDMLADTEPFTASTDLTFSETILTPAGLRDTRNEVIDGFLRFVRGYSQGFASTATANQNQVCPVEIACDYFPNSRPSFNAYPGCWTYSTNTTAATCANEFGGTPGANNCRVGNTTNIPCDDLVGLFQTYFGYDIASEVLLALMAPQPDFFGGFNYDSSVMMMDDDVYINDNGYVFIFQSSIPENFDLDYELYDPYASDFDVEYCLTLQCTTITIESTFGRLIRMATYALAVKGAIFVSAVFLFKFLTRHDQVVPANYRVHPKQGDGLDVDGGVPLDEVPPSSTGPKEEEAEVVAVEGGDSSDGSAPQ